MAYMPLTLEVSKLSGWLNTDASCRESKGEHAVRGEVDGSAVGRQARRRRGRPRRKHSVCRAAGWIADRGQGTGGEERT